MELSVECTIVVQPGRKFSTFTEDLHLANFRIGLKEVRAVVIFGLARKTYQTVGGRRVVKML
jgi:hypothetical protein